MTDILWHVHLYTGVRNVHGHNVAPFVGIDGRGKEQTFIQHRRRQLVFFINPNLGRFAIVGEPPFAFSALFCNKNIKPSCARILSWHVNSAMAMALKHNCTCICCTSFLVAGAPSGENFLKPFCMISCCAWHHFVKCVIISATIFDSSLLYSRVLSLGSAWHMISWQWIFWQ